MRPLRSLLIFVAGVFLGGALLAPWLYWIVQAGAHHLATLETLARNPFHRFVNRSLLGLALLGLWPFLRSLGFESLNDMGLVRPGGQGRRLAGGFALGFGSLACVAALALVTGARRVNSDLAAIELVRKLAGIAITATVVAVIEEVLFRGALFGAMRKVWHWKFALVLSSAVFAILHFMKSADLIGPVRWSSGLELLPWMLSGFADWRAVIPGFFNLALVGAILAVAYQRTGNLWFSIGLHAGWVFWLKSYNLLTSEVPHARAWFLAGGKLIDGWLVLPLLVVIFVAVLGRSRQPDNRLAYDGFYC